MNVGRYAVAALALGGLALMSAGPGQAPGRAPGPVAAAPTAPRPTSAPLASVGRASPAPPDDGSSTSGFPFLPGEARRPVSAGDTSNGSLIDGVHLTPSESLGILPRQRAHGLDYASAALAAMLREAASSLHRDLGRRLWIGHLSRRGGGDVAYSVSHNNGRDADIAFCYRDRRGKPVEPDDLLRVTPQGVAVTRGWRLDLACNWHIVKTLISSTKGQAQYLFVSGSLEGLILRHATEQGEPAELLERAEAVMMQPGNAAPHDDHLHLRIHCDEGDVLAGCRHLGIVHPWSRLYEDERARFLDEVLQLVDAEAPASRRLAIERLGWLASDQDAQVVPALERRLDDDFREVRLAASAALARMGHPDHALDRARPRELRLAAIATWSDHLHAPAVPWLDALLGDEEVASEARRALRRLTNRDLGRWDAWWQDMRHSRRRVWVVSGFRDAGYDVLDIDQAYTWELLRALGGAPHLSENAARALTTLYAHEPMPWAEERRDALCRAWQGWREERAELYPLPPPAREPCG